MTYCSPALMLTNMIIHAHPQPFPSSVFFECLLFVIQSYRLTKGISEEKEQPAKEVNGFSLPLAILTKAKKGSKVQKDHLGQALQW